MNRENLEKLSTADLVALTLADMKMRLVGHRNFLEQMLFTRIIAQQALARDLPTNTLEDVITKQVTAAPGRFEDPRIVDLPLPLARRLANLAGRLRGKKYVEDVKAEELSELIKDIKQFGADIQPVYDWHAEIRRDFERAEAALN